MVVSAASSIGAHTAGGGYADPTFPLVPLCCTLLASPHLAVPPPPSLHFTSPRRTSPASPPLLSPCLTSPHLTANRVASLRPASSSLFFCPAASTRRIVALPRALSCEFLVRNLTTNPKRATYLPYGYYIRTVHTHTVSVHIFQKSARRSPFIFLFSSSALGQSNRIRSFYTEVTIEDHLALRTFVRVFGSHGRNEE